MGQTSGPCRRCGNEPDDCLCGTLFGQRRNALRAAFDRFHRDNPHVYRMFCAFTDQAIAAGHRH